MTTNARRKEVHDLLSTKIAEKRKRRREVSEEEAKNPPLPPTVNNYLNNKPTKARSLNMQPVIDAPRRILPTEGMPTTNANSTKETVEKFVRKVASKTKGVNPEDAHISNPPMKKVKNGK